MSGLRKRALLRGRFIVSVHRLKAKLTAGKAGSYWSSSCPGKSWHFLMISAERRSMQRLKAKGK